MSAPILVRVLPIPRTPDATVPYPGIKAAAAEIASAAAVPSLTLSIVENPSSIGLLSAASTYSLVFPVSSTF
jgi:hypothetical protein